MFREEGIKISDTWTNEIGANGGEVVKFIVNPNDKPSESVPMDDAEINDDALVACDNMPDNIPNPSNDNQQSRDDNDAVLNEIEELIKELDQWDETKNDLPINPGTLDTLLLPTDNVLMKLAPGEGRKPLVINT